MPARLPVCLVTVVAILRLTTPAQAAEDAAFEAAKLVGTWAYVSAEKGGEKSGPERLKGKVVITEDKLTLKGDDGDFVMKYELDQSKTPVAIKLTIVESPFGEGATANGIIQLKDKQLKLCYGEMGEGAPKEFASPSGSKARLIVLKPAE